MFDKVLEIKDAVVNKAKNVGLVQGLEIFSGVTLLLGGICINFLSSDELLADDILEKYDSPIEIEDAVIEDKHDE